MWVYNYLPQCVSTQLLKSVIVKLMIYITIHMPQRTSKILLGRLTANKNALLFQFWACFAHYTVWFGVTRSDQNTVNDYFTQSRSMITMRNFLFHCASPSAMNTCTIWLEYGSLSSYGKKHFTLDDKIHFCGICIVKNDNWNQNFDLQDKVSINFLPCNHFLCLLEGDRKWKQENIERCCLYLVWVWYDVWFW